MSQYAKIAFNFLPDFSDVSAGLNNTRQRDFMKVKAKT